MEGGKFVLMAILDLAGCVMRKIGVILWDAKPRRVKTQIALCACWLLLSAIRLAISPVVERRVAPC